MVLLSLMILNLNSDGHFLFLFNKHDFRNKNNVNKSTAQLKLSVSRAGSKPFELM